MRYRVTEGAHVNVSGPTLVGPCEVEWREPPADLAFLMQIGAVVPVDEQPPMAPTDDDKGASDGDS